MSCILHSRFSLRAACFLTKRPVVLQAAKIGNGVWSCNTSQGHLDTILQKRQERGACYIVKL